MDISIKQLCRKKKRIAVLCFKRRSKFQIRALQTCFNIGRNDRGVVSVAILFLLAIACTMVATTIGIHLEMRQKQAKLMREFAHEWNKH